MPNGLSKDEKDHLQKLAPLVGRRIRLSLALSALLLVGYALYAFLLTGDGALAAMKVGGQMTLVILASVIMVILGVSTAGIYTWWCRTNLDPHVDRIREGQSNE